MMIRLDFYNRRARKRINWVKKRRKYLYGSVVPYYGHFLRGWVLEDGNLRETIILTDKDYDLYKQYRKSRDHFSLNCVRAYEPRIMSHSGFDTLEDCLEYYKTTPKIPYKSFLSKVHSGKAKFMNGRVIEILYKQGVVYDLIP